MKSILLINHFRSGQPPGGEEVAGPERADKTAPQVAPRPGPGRPPHGNRRRPRPPRAARAAHTRQPHPGVQLGDGAAQGVQQESRARLVARRQDQGPQGPELYRVGDVDGQRFRSGRLRGPSGVAAGGGQPPPLPSPLPPAPPPR
jgi:hypothetical protein